MNWTKRRRPAPDAAVALDELEAGLQQLFAVPVPALTFEPGPAPRLARHGRLRPALVVAGVVAFAVAAAVFPRAWGDQTPGVNAQELFERASATTRSSAAAASYHLVATSSAPGSPASHSETWSRDAAHMWTQQTNDGEEPSVYGMALNGPEGYLWATFSGTLRAVHFASGGSAVASAGAGSLQALLAKYNDGDCQAATIDGEDELLGRPVVVVTVRPTVHCAKVAVSPPGKATSADIEKAKSLATKRNELRMWIDRDTFVPLRTESRDENGEVGYRYEVTVFEAGIEIPDAIFRFDPPAGVTLIDVQDAASAKAVLSCGRPARGYCMATTPEKQPAPVKNGP